MIGIIAAMEIEAKALIDLMENKKEEEISSVVFHKGTLQAKDVVVAVCGVGKVNSAVCTQTMILKYHPELIINTGVGGGIRNDMEIGEIVLAKDVLQHDMDTSPLGDPRGFISGINKVYIPAHTAANEAFINISHSLPSLKVSVGRIASGDQFINSDDQRRRLTSEFGADVCEMEGASIGQVCYLNNVPFCVLRAVSDNGDDSSNFDFMKFCAKAAENSVLLLTEFLKLYQNKD